MKGIHVITIVFLASWTVITASKLPIIFEAENECPVPDEGPPKLINHEKECDKYYKCRNGKKQLRSCQVGLYFSKKWQGCVDYEISDCAPIEVIDECPNRNDCPPKLIPHETDCTKYYECRNGEKQLRSCQVGLYFSKKWQGCVDYEISDCAPIEVIDECPNRNDCPPKLIPHETDCTKYYECRNGEKQLRSCQVGLYFSKKWQGCVDYEISDCPPTEVIDKCPNRNDCPPKLIPHKTDCTKYYECKDGEKQPRFCQTGLYFSERWHGCVDYNISDCFKPTRPTDPTPTDPTPTDPTPTDPTPTDPTPRPRCINGDLLEHECKCTKYYLCLKGRKVVLECPAGKHFNLSTKTCIPGTSCLEMTPTLISNSTPNPNAF